MAAVRRGAKPAVKRASGKAAPSAALKMPRIGEVWKGQGGRFAGLIRGEKGQPDYAILLSAKTITGEYGPVGRVKGAESEYDGLANTRAMAEAGSAIAREALAHRADGHADFYIPSRHEARLVDLNLREHVKGGWYWTSTQHRASDDYAWVQGFGVGTQSHNHKDYRYSVVLVRRLVIR